MTYTETVTRIRPVEVTESIHVPAALVQLVNGRDKRYGRNGTYYIACNTARNGGATIDRLMEYVHHHDTYHDEDKCEPCDCPIKLA